MSAIAGIFHLNGEPVPYEHGNGMMNSLQKYPADDVQTWNDGQIFLGCHAQWITPESVGEQLPYYESESQLAITADAIIDNRDELFDKLGVDQGCRKQMADSKLILRSYQKWGEACPKYLIGDFAFMIWDKRDNKLFGARDFSGSRTLYYTRVGQKIAFCTAIMPLFTLPYQKKELNEQWLAEFLAIYGMVDAMDVFSTIYQNIKQVPPSCSISIGDNEVRLSRYNKIAVNEKLHLHSNQEYEEAFQDVFNTAVNARLRSIHKIGSHLSGGLDSGSVVSIAAKTLREQNKKLHTYSYVPDDSFIDWTPKYMMPDERPFIQETIRHVGNIDDKYLNCKDQSPLSVVDYWLEMMEMPYKFFENSYWLKGIFERASDDGIGILLNGARGNFTISWGPALDFYTILLKKMKWLKLYRELKLYTRNNGTGRSKVMKVILKRLLSTSQRYAYSSESNTLIHPEFAKQTKVFDKIQSFSMDKVVDVYKSREKFFEEVFHWNATGTSSSKCSLRNSLWERDPTNDIRVIQFCLSVPEEQCVQEGLDRALIRRTTDLPNQVRLNQKTRGVQSADWVHRMIPHWKEFTAELEQIKSNEICLQILNVEAIQKIISNIGEKPRPELAFNPDMRLLMRALIVFRFVKSFA